MLLQRKPAIYIEDILYENEKRFYLSFKSPLYTNGKITGILGTSILLNANHSYNYLSEELIECLQFLQYSRFQNTLSVNEDRTKLTNRQKECLHYLARGMSVKKIDLQLKLSPKTVECHLGLLKRKLRVSARHELIEKAYELGLV